LHNFWQPSSSSRRSQQEYLCSQPYEHFGGK
jgi:hypothetical protein